MEPVYLAESERRIAIRRQFVTWIVICVRYSSVSCQESLFGATVHLRAELQWIEGKGNLVEDLDSESIEWSKRSAAAETVMESHAEVDGLVWRSRSGVLHTRL